MDTQLFTITETVDDHLFTITGLIVGALVLVCVFLTLALWLLAVKRRKPGSNVVENAQQVQPGPQNTVKSLAQYDLLRLRRKEADDDDNVNLMMMSDFL